MHFIDNPYNLLPKISHKDKPMRLAIYQHKNMLYTAQNQQMKKIF